MILKIKFVSQKNFQDLPDFRLFPFSCKYCVYWESSGDFDEKVEKSSAEKIKRNWFRKVSKEFGNCGFIVYLEDTPVGYAQYAPARFLPRTQQYRSGPVSKDAVFLACLYIPKRELRGKGIGRYLLNHVLSDLKNRDYNAVEAFARTTSESAPVSPLSFYLKNGFIVKREKDKFPLVRRELNSKLRKLTRN
jgi:GNAT superfamily N-acetyltransferase